MKISENSKALQEKVLKKYILEELFKDYKGDYKPGEYDWGMPVGKEEW